ncbi:salivary glue protein Sgs-3-like [Enoplosus armatus]|uniref:salivary glue protein Sgs-3-like n=1 Tax=Enoplosus armatus TaxID=215367 RepID=UPI0039969D19
MSEGCDTSGNASEGAKNRAMGVHFQDLVEIIDPYEKQDGEKEGMDFDDQEEIRRRLRQAESRYRETREIQDKLFEHGLAIEELINELEEENKDLTCKLKKTRRRRRTRTRRTRRRRRRRRTRTRRTRTRRTRRRRRRTRTRRTRTRRTRTRTRRTRTRRTRMRTRTRRTKTRRTRTRTSRMRMKSTKMRGSRRLKAGAVVPRACGKE